MVQITNKKRIKKRQNKNYYKKQKSPQTNVYGDFL